MTKFCVACAAAFALASLVAAQPKPGGDDSLSAMALEELMDLRVESATLRKQSLQDAPSSVTVITAESIRRYGYRTLGEALASTRSFYQVSDGPMRYVGARGFSLLGDYNTRFLVLINGRPMTDNVYGAMYYFGQDFPLDMDLVEQIEIVRGPSSALYGSNGLFATVNIITKAPSGFSRQSVVMEAGSFGEQKLRASTVFGAGGMTGIISATALNIGGRSAYFPELQQPGEPRVRTDGIGRQAGYRLFADLRWRQWSVTALWGETRLVIPTGWFGTEVGDTGTRDLEARNFLQAAWTGRIGNTGSLRWRLYYDQFRYDGIFSYGERRRNFDGAIGDWAGTELVSQHPTAKFGTFTAGIEARFDLRNTQYNYDITDGARTDNFRISHPRHGYGIFAQQEFKLSGALTAYLGGRMDDTTYDPVAFAPRAALIYQKRGAAYKFMYGRAFRNPSTYERFWMPNPALTAERIDTVEISREQTLHRRANLIVSMFHYRLGGLIVGEPVNEDELQYRNSGRAGATGFEAELNGHPTEWLDASASYSIQRARGSDGHERLQNSPVRLGRFRASTPLARNHLLLSGSVGYIGARMDAYGGHVPSTTLSDVTLTFNRLQPNFDLQFGVRNLMNSSYSDPLSAEHATLLMPGAGRSVYVRLVWRKE